MYLKTFLAYTAKHDLELTRRGDIGNAYAKAKSIRELGYMHLPSTLRSLDEDGEPPCIELHTPIWGEREAGYKWQCTFAESILKMGWKSCEGVTAMHAVQKPVGGIAATISTIVDDFLIAKSGNPITRAMLANLKAIFEKLAIQSAPDSFSGYKVARNRTSCAITMSMPQKIIEAAHAPQDETHAVAKEVLLVYQYGILITYNRGAIVHMTRQTRAIAESSHHSEAIATSEAAKEVMNDREVLRAPQRDATSTATNDRSNQVLWANDATSAKPSTSYVKPTHNVQAASPTTKLCSNTTWCANNRQIWCGPNYLLSGSMASSACIRISKTYVYNVSSGASLHMLRTIAHT